MVWPYWYYHLCLFTLKLKKLISNYLPPNTKTTFLANFFHTNPKFWCMVYLLITLGEIGLKNRFFIAVIYWSCYLLSLTQKAKLRLIGYYGQSERNPFSNSLFQNIQVKYWQLFALSVPVFKYHQYRQHIIRRYELPDNHSLCVITYKARDRQLGNSLRI